MNFYLSSLDELNKEEYKKLFPANKINKIALITNAWETYPKEKSQPFIKETKKQLKLAGFRVILVDLKKYKNKTEELKGELAKYGGVWVTGGNSFYLNWLIRESGFAHALNEQSKVFVYGGGSAGAAVAGTTLHGIEFLDNKDDAPEVVYKSMGLVDFAILPHWGLEKYGENLRKCKKEMERFSKVQLITNDQAILIDNSKIRIL